MEKHWQKAFEKQTIKFGHHQIPVNDIKGIILNTLKRKIREQDQYMWSELYSDCLSFIPELAISFNRSNLCNGKKDNVMGYIKKSIFYYIGKLTVVNHVVQRGPKDNPKKTDAICFSLDKSNSNSEKYNKFNILEKRIEFSTGFETENKVAESLDITSMALIAMDCKDLDEKEKFIIHERYFLDWARTYSEIGKDLGLRKDRIRQLESNALKKMHKELKQQNLI